MNRCPKCHGPLVDDVRSIGVIVRSKRCWNCGLSSEQVRFWDAIHEIYRPVDLRQR